MFLSHQSIARAPEPVINATLPGTIAALPSINAQDAGFEQTDKEEVVTEPVEKTCSFRPPRCRAVGKSVPGPSREGV